MFHRGDQIYAIQTDENTGWRIVGVSYLDEVVNQQVQTAVRILTMLLAAVLFTAVVSSILLSRVVSRPIHGLVKAMQDFEKNAEAFSYTPEGGTKEVVELSQSFEHMVGQIQELMSQVRNEEITLRKTELKALQAQINPHFLYNTLFSVKTLIDLQRYQMASNMFQSLIDFYVISLNHGKERVTIRKELEVINHYLSILKIRYNESFEWLVNVDEDILDCEILTLTLQPLVENAVQHGIKNKTEKGMIDISGCSLEGTIILTVWDNGEGISPETLEVLENDINEKELQDKKENPHFGLWNSNQRLKLYFGEEYGIQMESEKGKYTSVTVRIPEKKYEG